MGSEPIQSPILCLQQSFPDVKQPEHETDHSSSFSAEIKNN